MSLNTEIKKVKLNKTTDIYSTKLYTKTLENELYKQKGDIKVASALVETLKSQFVKLEKDNNYLISQNKDLKDENLKLR